MIDRQSGEDRSDGNNDGPAHWSSRLVGLTSEGNVARIDRFRAHHPDRQAAPPWPPALAPTMTGAGADQPRPR